MEVILAVVAVALTAHPGAGASHQRRIAADATETMLEVPVGDGPYDVLRLHRVEAGGEERPRRGVLLLHGDFANFDSDFVGAGEGLATALARAGLDVWGFDRRWTLVPQGAQDLSALHGQGFAFAIADAERALAVARTLRALSGDGADPLAVVGFSRGGQLAWALASAESQLPRPLRSADAFAILDMALHAGSDQSQAAACGRLSQEQADYAAGVDAADNSLFGALGALALSAPLDASPIFPGASNGMALELVVGQTFAFFALTPWYHLDGVATDAAGNPTQFAFAPFGAVAAFFAAAPPWQAQAELVDGDALLCGQGPQPVADHLADVTAPVLFIGAAGGVGTDATTTLTELPRPATVRLVRLLPEGQEAADFGHADLLWSARAGELSWDALSEWLLER
jgi:pimeloyl-ACP methyl ester carboxylesterase